MLVVGAAMIPAGRLADIVGRQRVLLAGIVLFAATGAACAAASSEAALIVLRLVQGLGAAMIFPVGIAIVTNEFPESRRAGRSASCSGSRRWAPRPDRSSGECSPSN